MCLFIPAVLFFPAEVRGEPDPLPPLDAAQRALHARLAQLLELQLAERRRLPFAVDYNSGYSILGIKSLVLLYCG